MSNDGMFARVIAVVVAARAGWRVLRRRGTPAGGAGGGVGGSDPTDLAPGEDPRRRDVPGDPRAELWVALLLFGAAATALSFIVIYVVQKFNTQLLGIAIGVTFALLAAAAILAGKIIVPQQTSVEARGALLEESEVEEITELVHHGGDGVSRRGLLVCAGCVAGGAVAVAAAAPLASLGPPAGVLRKSPWRRGVKIVDTENQPLRASEIQIGSFYTGLPLGGDWEQFASGLLVIRLPQPMIHLPPGRAGWTPAGIMAFSKICPHAGCAISLYRYPTYAPTSTDEPAFTCPCHYSTFTPADGGKVIFGPAGRPLPQLPVTIDAQGNLEAGGEFDESIGPSWWGTRRT